MKNELRDLSNKCIEMASKFGADQSEVILSKSESFTLKAHMGELTEHKVSGSGVVGVRVIKDNKVGISYSESIDEDSLKLMTENALINASFSPESPEEQISVNSGEIISESSHTFNQDNTSIQEKIDLILEIESKTRELDKSVKNCPYNQYSDSISHHVIANSNGSFCYEKGNYFSAYCSALVEVGDISAMHSIGDAARLFKAIDKQKIINRPYDLASKLISSKEIKTGSYDVIFSTEILGQLLGCFSNIYSAKSAIEGINPFKDKLGENIASPLLTMKDCPQYKDSLNYSLFDSEGAKTSDITLINNGVFSEFLHNSKTARKLNMKNNFRAARGAKSSLDVSGTTKVITEGSSSKAELYSDKIIEVHSIQGLYSGADRISGNFSFAISGYLKEKGEFIHSFRGITLSGNFFDLIKNIKCIGNSLETNEYKSFYSPLIRFSDLTIAGK